MKLTATYHHDELDFSVVNEGGADAFVANNFCFEPNMKAVAVNSFFGRVVGTFTSGISRLVERMVLLRGGGGHYECSIPFESEHDLVPKEHLFIVWDTTLFIGWRNGTYKNGHFDGLIPVPVPNDSKKESEKQVDTVGLYTFQHMDTLGFIDPRVGFIEPKRKK